MAVLRFEAAAPGLVEVRSVSATEKRFQAPVEEFTLSRIIITRDASHGSPRHRNVEILFVTGGRLVLSLDNGDQRMPLTRGDSVLVPAAVGSYRLSGEAEIYQATVPQW